MFKLYKWGFLVLPTILWIGLYKRGALNHNEPIYMLLFMSVLAIAAFSLLHWGSKH